jgi:hypothetical protein
LKYNIKDLSVKERAQYVDMIMSKMLDNCKYIPFNNRLNWCVSPMPATECGKTKLAWRMAEEISKQLRLSFIEPILSCDKPQMKQLSTKEKIGTWEKIYYNDGVILDNQVRGKNVITAIPSDDNCLAELSVILIPESDTFLEPVNPTHLFCSNL